LGFVDASAEKKNEFRPLRVAKQRDRYHQVQRGGVLRLKAAIFCVATAAFASSAVAATATAELQEELAAFDMTFGDLASWMQNVLEMRGYQCGEVLSMAGQVPRVNPETRRNAALSVTCEEKTYFITVGIEAGWQIND
tara:strand:- start:1876 stop:2289 length:414 start_codon:yes stop_codon:yes gene_type:complete